MFYNACKKYVIIVLLFNSFVVRTMELVNLPHDVLAHIALPLVNNNHIPFAFQHKKIPLDFAEGANKTFNLLYDHASYDTFSYISFTLTCKKIYEALNIKSCMPQQVDLYNLIKWLENFRSGIAKKIKYDLIHSYNINEVQEGFLVEIACWSRRANAQWVIKCIQTNQVKNKEGIISAMNGNRPLLAVTPLWALISKFITYSTKENLQLTHVKKIGDHECSFTIAGNFKKISGRATLLPSVLYCLMQQIAQQGYFDWVDDTNKELVIEFFLKYCVMSESSKKSD